MDAKSITLILENCETISLERKFIGTFFLNDIQERIARIAVNSIAKQKMADELILEIFSDANNVDYYPFGDTDDGAIRIFDRLTEYGDITSVEIVWEDESIDDILVPWNDAHECFNEYQKYYLSKNGNLYIVVSKEKEIKDHFDLEEIDDPKYTDWACLLE